jgi:hypothetical protein
MFIVNILQNYKKAPSVITVDLRVINKFINKL